MTATAEDRRLKLQEINGGVQGVMTAPDRMPDRLNESWLPCAVTYPGPARHNLAAVGYRRVERTWMIRLYVRPFAIGQDTHQGFYACVPFLERFPETYMARSNIAVATGEWEFLEFGEPDGDGGISIIGLHGDPGGPSYWGIEFEVVTVHKESV